MTNIESVRIWFWSRMIKKWPKLAKDIWWSQAAAWNQCNLRDELWNWCHVQKWLVWSEFLVEIFENWPKNYQKRPKIFFGLNQLKTKLSHTNSCDNFETVFSTRKWPYFSQFLVNRDHKILKKKFFKVQQNFIYKFLYKFSEKFMSDF